MQRMFLKILAIALLLSPAGYGQSLGDIARENREKKAEDASAAPSKVITNADLPKNTQPKPALPDKQAEKTIAAVDHRSAQQRLAEERAADQWKKQILAQKYRMATLQARIDQLNASIRSENGSAQFEGPVNRYQARQMQQVAQIQQQLDEQQRKLDQMQESARRAGMHTAVYDP